MVSLLPAARRGSAHHPIPSWRFFEGRRERLSIPIPRSRNLTAARPNGASVSLSSRWSPGRDPATQAVSILSSDHRRQHLRL